MTRLMFSRRHAWTSNQVVADAEQALARDADWLGEQEIVVLGD